LKSFEVANSLADTILLTSPGVHSGFELGPQDFLHALYQKLSPFLEQDEVLNSILRTKTAEVLVMAPARLLRRELGDSGFEWKQLGKDNSQINEQQQLEVNPLFGDLDEQLAFPLDQPYCNNLAQWNKPGDQFIFTKSNHSAI